MWDEGKNEEAFPQMITLSHVVLQFSDYRDREAHTNKDMNETRQQTRTACELHQGHSFDDELWDKLTSTASHHSLAESRERSRAKSSRGAETPDSRQRQSQVIEAKQRRGENDKGDGFSASRLPLVRCHFARLIQW